MSIYLTMLTECYLRANFASLPIYFICPHSSLFVAHTSSVCHCMSTPMCVDVCLRKSIIVWLRLCVDICYI